MNHDIVEKHIGLMIVLIVVAISFGGTGRNRAAVFQKQTTTAGRPV